MQKIRHDFLLDLAKSALQSVSEGYYQVDKTASYPHVSLLRAIRSHATPIIAEIKFISPAEGRLSAAKSPEAIAKNYQRGGAAAISVITEPKHFGGELQYLRATKGNVKIPVIMKDVIVDKIQVEAGQKLGADAILLIMGIFRAKLATSSLSDMIEYAHACGLEVILEVHNEAEYVEAAKTKADIVGINNRNLSTLDVSLAVTEQLLAIGKPDKPIVSESGFRQRAEIVRLLSMGVDAFLVGSALMKSKDPVTELKKLQGES